MIWGHRAVMKMQVAAVISTFRTLRFRNTRVKNSGRGHGRCTCARGDSHQSAAFLLMSRRKLISTPTITA